MEAQMEESFCPLGEQFGGVLSLFFGYSRRGFVGSCIRQRVLPARSGASAPCAPQRRRRLRQHSRRECHPAGTLRDSDTWLFALPSQDTTLAENQTHAHRAADPSWNLPFPVTTGSLHSHRLQSHHAGITRDGVCVWGGEQLFELLNEPFGIWEVPTFHLRVL